ncbi:MAG: cysteine peptidase family C39 domain-containing protein [Verrucomicrobiae bacterium]|nr:cysteine peptidase family C39 domain-containing protein [Verrucomicrobiae bacterium]
MNPLFIPTILLAVVLFFIGKRAARKLKSPWLPIIGIIAAIPAVAFAAYYAKLFGEAGWLYWYRSLPGSELTAAGLGVFTGWLEVKREQSPRLKNLSGGLFVPFLMVLCVSAPYLKQILLRPDWNKFENHWSENVCLQSSESSCGPASAATLLRYFGKETTELEIAREAFTTRRGTENWYLLRTIRRHGLAADYTITNPGSDSVIWPAIAGVRLNHADGAGHFIAVLGRAGEHLVIGDPLTGREELTRTELANRYVFTGFYLTCNQPENRR